MVKIIGETNIYINTIHKSFKEGPPPMQTMKGFIIGIDKVETKFPTICATYQEFVEEVHQKFPYVQELIPLTSGL